MDKIEIQNKILYVPEYPTIPVIIGDDTGKEIWKNARQITAEAIKRCYSEKRGINWLEMYIDESNAQDQYQSQTDAIIETLNTYNACINALTGRSANKENKSLKQIIQRKLDLYACMKHFKWINGIITPIRKPENIDITVFREISEDIYAGMEWRYNSSEGAKVMHFLEDEMRVKKIRFPRTSNIAVKVISKEGCERITQAALDYAKQSGAYKLTIVHNSIMEPAIEGAFVNWAYDLIERVLDGKVMTMKKYRETKENLGDEIAQEELENAFAKQLMIVDDLEIGDFMNQALMSPEKFDIVVSLNKDGDIIDQFLASISGSKNLMPYVNKNNETGRAVFGVDQSDAINQREVEKSNPCAMIFACASLLEQINWSEASELIRRSVERVIAQGKVTEDLTHNFTNGIKLSATEFSEEVIKMIRNI